MASSQKRHQIDHNSEHPKQFLTDSKRQQRQEECVASVDLGVVNGTNYSLLHRPRAFRNETIVTFMTGIGSDVVIQGRNDGPPVSTSLTLFRVPNVTSTIASLMYIIYI